MTAAQPQAQGLTDEQERLVQTLRGFGEAYPTDMFGPVTDDERARYGGLITRASAGMGRHMAKFTARAADLIEALAAHKRPP